MSDLSQDVTTLRQNLDEIQAMVLSSIEALRDQMEELYKGLKKTKTDWALCKNVVHNRVLTNNSAPPMIVEVPRPRRYGGKR